MAQNPFIADDGYTPSEQEISSALRVLFLWGGLRDRHLDEQAIVTRMLVAAHNGKLLAAHNAAMKAET